MDCKANSRIFFLLAKRVVANRKGEIIYLPRISICFLWIGNSGSRLLWPRSFGLLFFARTTYWIIRLVLNTDQGVCRHCKIRVIKHFIVMKVTIFAEWAISRGFNSLCKRIMATKPDNQWSFLELVEVTLCVMEDLDRC